MKGKDRLYFALVGLCLALLIILIIYLLDQGGQCLRNPYLYGASKMGNIQCDCLQTIDPSCPAQFSFNDTNFDSTPVPCGQSKGLYHEINLNLSERRE